MYMRMTMATRCSREGDVLTCCFIVCTRIPRAAREPDRQKQKKPANAAAGDRFLALVLRGCNMRQMTTPNFFEAHE
jgi:hypothetical protein